MIELLLIFSFLFLLFTSVILFRNLLTFRKLRPDESLDLPLNPRVTVCIPARNEEKVIEDCIIRLLDQSYENYSILLLDDFSTDGTGKIINRMVRRYDDVAKAIASEKPDDWLGKPWACQQLYEQSDGEIIIYLDADTKVARNFIESIVLRMETEELDALSVWPEQILTTTSENLIIPMVYHALWSFLFVGYVQRPPRWIPPFLRKKLHPMFAAACGQCMVFRRYALIELLGYQSVKANIVDDVGLAKGFITNGFNYTMFYGTDSIRCRMYESLGQIFQGFRKNFFAGFNYNYALFLMMALLYGIVFLLPIYTLTLGIIEHDPFLVYLSSLVLMIPIFQRMILANLFNWPSLMGFTHIFGILFFQILGWVSILDRLFKRQVTWKGRSIN